MCHDEEKGLIYVFTSQYLINNTADFSLYLVELDKQRITRLIHGNKKHRGIVNHLICNSGILVFTIQDYSGIWTRYHEDAQIVYDNVGNVFEVLMSDDNPTDIALLTEDNIV
ncbi:hypothetical protein RF11_08306 [Thelohanellus kitauei]|uniref:Uncharacterized protein n=1 Tax=Thelohanellus kitauei TaxID=669202 RepID=A0A0C2JAT7_THEKT|nr:hypothetical protein RF11_08306 [Thelohanellus kitauei]